MEKLYFHLSTCLLLLLTFSYSYSQTTVVIPAEMDNAIYEGESDFSNGAGAYFMVGRNGSSPQRARRGLIKFDITGNLPVGNLKILSAELKLYLHKSADKVDNVNLSLFRIAQAWGEGNSTSGNVNGGDGQGEGNGEGAQASNGDATWEFAQYHNNVNNRVSWTTLGGDYDPDTSATLNIDKTPGTKTWTTLEDDIQDMYDNPNTNFGWIIIGNETDKRSMRKFRSKEHPDGESPSLTIEYIDLGFPIELVSFEAQIHNTSSAVELAWSTASERDHAYFGIERSVNGRLFQEIGQVRSAGHSSVLQTYTYKDPFIQAPKVYYRLKSVDINGVFSYSQIEMLRLPNIGIPSMVVYPNPIQGSHPLRLEIKSQVDLGNVSIEVLDIMGKKRQNFLVEVWGGTQTHILPLDNLGSGVYFLRIIDAQVALMKQFVIQH